MTRLGWVSTTCFSALSIGVSALVHPAPKLICNASASVPIGLYTVHRVDTLHVGELLVITPPEPLAIFLDQRHYLPKGVPLLKRVAALPGHTVCRTGQTIFVDGVAMGQALERDRLGRPLPVWQGCRVIAPGQVFLMNQQSSDSFDGRYFGLLPSTTIVGRAEPLITFEKD